jgi:hypothetical protein
MSWSLEDIRNWKELFGKRLDKKVRSERAIYPLLASWIRSQRPKSKISIGGMQGTPLIDVVEMNEKGELIGYEVKMAHVGKRESERSVQTLFIIQGIGQAIEHLYRGVDYSYLVAPQITGLEHLSYMLEKTVPIGLILFDRNFRFEEVLRAKKAQIYQPEDRETIEFVYFGKGMEELEKELKNESDKMCSEGIFKLWHQKMVDVRWQEIKKYLDEFPELRKRIMTYLQREV